MSLSNYRIDPFTGEDKSVLIENESVTVPGSAPYDVDLEEIPKKYTVSLGFGGATAPEILDRLEFDAIRSAASSVPDTALGALTTFSVGDVSISEILPTWAYFDFDHNNIPSNFGQCFLWMYMYGDGDHYAGPFTETRTLSIFWNIAAWNPATITWNNRPSWTGGATQATLDVTREVGWKMVEVTSMINNMKTGGGSNNGFGIRDLGDQTQSSASRFFYSADGNDYPPYLIWTEGGSNGLVEVAPTSADEFQVNQARSKIRLHSSRAGQAVNVTYRGLGSSINKKKLELELI